MLIQLHVWDLCATDITEDPEHAREHFTVTDMHLLLS